MSFFQGTKDFEREFSNFKGRSQNLYSIDGELLVDALDVGLFGSLDPESPSVSRKISYHKNQQFWEDVLSGKLQHGDTIELMDFNLLEWLPSNPGKYHTPEAKYYRKEALTYASKTRNEFIPHGKKEMILGGVGSVRLAPRSIRSGEVTYFGATSNGISHQGIPVIAPSYECINILRAIKAYGGVVCNIVGSLWPLPLQDSPLKFARGIPKYYLFADQIKVVNRSRSSDLLVSVSITYVDRRYVRDSQWSFASFNPANGEKGLHASVDWLKEYVLRYKGEDRSILGDFDELYSHFDTPIEFELKSILEGRYSHERLEYYGGRFGITIKQEFIMGDKFENISGTVVNRSIVNNSFNIVKKALDEDAANFLQDLTEKVNKTESVDAIENMEGFHLEIQKPKPKKSLLTSFWNGVVAAAPALIDNTGKIMDLVEKVSKFLPT